MTDPKFSIVIPTLNRPLMVLEAIASALAQTESDLEVIVVDNYPAGPMTTTISDSRLRIIRNPEMVSACDNWNIGLNQVKGEFVSFLCDDDVFLPDFLRQTYELLQRDSNCRLVTTPWHYVDSQLEIIQTASSLGWKFFPILTAKQFVLDVLDCRRALTLDSTLCRTEDLRRVGGFKPAGFSSPWCVDHYALYRVALLGTVVRTTVDPLLRYRLHSENISCELTVNQCDRLVREMDNYFDTLSDVREAFDYLAFDNAFSNYRDFFVRLLDRSTEPKNQTQIRAIEDQP